MLSLIGISLALLAIVGGNYLEGGQLVQLINPPAALIVFGGTFAAALVQTPHKDFTRAWRLVGWSFSAPTPDIHQGIQEVMEWCGKARRTGLLVLEADAARHPDPFIANGLQLLADGRPAEEIRNILEIEMIATENREIQSAKVIEGMGGYAPTLGIIGAVLGLIQVMANLTEPEALGEGIATAFVATIYGIGAANLFFIPVANKIKRLVYGRAEYQQMMMEGMLYIAEGLGPQTIQQRLNGYLESENA